MTVHRWHRALIVSTFLLLSPPVWAASGKLTPLKEQVWRFCGSLLGLSSPELNEALIARTNVQKLGLLFQMDGPGFNLPEFKQRIVPQVTRDLQVEALEDLHYSGRYDRPEADLALMEVALLITNRDQLDVWNFLLLNGAPHEFLVRVPRLTDRMQLSALKDEFKKSSAYTRGLEPENYRPIRPEERVSVLVIGMIPENEGLRTIYGGSNRALRARNSMAVPSSVITADVVKSSPAEVRAISKSNLRRSRAGLKVVYRRYYEAQASVGALTDDFIELLVEEDRHLDQRRLLHFYIMGEDGAPIGAFGLYEATPHSYLSAAAVAMIQKHPELQGKFEAELRKIYQGRLPKRIVEVRRLGLRKDQERVNLQDVLNLIGSLYRNQGVDEMAVVAHTHRAGRAMFRRIGMTDVLEPEDFRGRSDGPLPDEYGLVMDIQQIYKITGQ